MTLNAGPVSTDNPLASKAALGTKSFGQLGKSGRLSLLPIPVLFYQAETGFGYGLGALLSGRFSDDTLTRPSNARVQYWTTEKGQSLLQLVLDGTTSPEEALRVSRHEAADA